jgi:hypothetical protein
MGVAHHCVQDKDKNQVRIWFVIDKEYIMKGI